MKKITRGICLMGLMALVATSCNKKQDTTTLQSYNQEMEVVAGEFDDGEKVWLNLSDNNLYFETGDLLTLFGINSSSDPKAATYTPTTGDQVDHTTWTPQDPNNTVPTDGDLYAFCPGGTDYVTPDLSNGNRATFKLPAVQHYRENTCPKEGFFMASKLEAGQESFFFKNICGVLWLQIYSPNNRKVTSIEVTDKGGKHLSGDVSLKIDKVNQVTLTSLYNNYNPNNATYMQTLADYITESGYSVTNAGGLTLVCDEPVQIGTTSATATTFMITLRPLALREGFEIKVNCEGGYSFTQKTNKNNIIGPNKIRKMPAFSIK